MTLNFLFHPQDSPSALFFLTTAFHVHGEILISSIQPFLF